VYSESDLDHRSPVRTQEKVKHGDFGSDVMNQNDGWMIGES
jgi:hypothetical protein